MRQLIVKPLGGDLTPLAGLAWAGPIDGLQPWQ